MSFCTRCALLSLQTVSKLIIHCHVFCTCRARLLFVGNLSTAMTSSTCCAQPVNVILLNKDTRIQLGSWRSLFVVIAIWLVVCCCFCFFVVCFLDFVMRIHVKLITMRPYVQVQVKTNSTRNRKGNKKTGKKLRVCNK